MGGAAYSAKTDLITGRFSYSVPISIPPGRQGAAPVLGLAYNSAAGNSWCGVGWNLDIGFIQRDTRRGVPVKWGTTNALNQYDDAKGFVVNFGGVSSRLVLISAGSPTGTYEYRAEVDSTFLKYLYYTNDSSFGPAYWEVTDKSGNKFYFGRTTASRMENTRTGWNIDNQGNQGKAVFRWALDRVVDVNGNETLVSYTKHGNLLYLTGITYNSNINDGNLPANNSVTFETIGRTDKSISFLPGYRVETGLLLSNIVVRANGSIVRSYSLSYTNSSSTFRTLLQSLTMFGLDGETTLPTQTFVYSVKPFEFENKQAWSGVNDQGRTTPWAAIRANDGDENTFVDLMDVDGDSLPDRVMHDYAYYVDGLGLYYTPEHFLTQRNTGSSFASTNGWGPLLSYGHTTVGGYVIRNNNSDADLSVDFSDINGDGLPDRVMRGPSPYTNFGVQLNLGVPTSSSGFTSTQNWGPITNESSSQSWRSIRYGGTVKVDLVDINGDGLPDRVARKLNSPYTNYFKVQLNTGVGFTALVNWGPLDSQSTAADWNSVYGLNTSSDTYVGLYDINGDGLPDRVMRRQNSPYTNFLVQYNNGAGFELKESWNSVNTQGSTSSSWGSPTAADNDGYTFATLADINGDGLLDRILRANDGTTNRFRVQINTGSGFIASLVDWSNLDNLGQASVGWYSPQGTRKGVTTSTDLMDMNGDGLVDRVTRSASSPYDKFWVQLNKGPAPDLLVETRNGIGGSTKISYKSSAQYNNRDKDFASDPWAENAKSLLGFNVWTVSSLTVSNGMGDFYTTSYDYRGGFYDTEDREFRGFNRVIETDPQGTRTVTYFHQSGGRDESAEGEYQDQTSVAKKGIPYRVEVTDASTNLYRLTLNKVEETQLHPSGWNFPYISQTIHVAYEGLGISNYRATAQGLKYDFATGNVLISTNYGQVQIVSLSDHQITDSVAGDTTYTITTYTNIGTILGKPLAITLSSSASGTPALRQSINKYDGRGNLTEAKAWLDTINDYVTNSIVSYDSVGNPIQASDAAGIVTTTIYDSAKHFPIKQITGTFTNEFLYNAASGILVWTKDPNGLTAGTDLDDLLRPIQTRISTNSINGPTLWRTKTDYVLLGAASDGRTTNYVRKRVYDPNDSVNGIESYSYSDGLGRTIQTRTESETNGVFRVTDVVFDNRGNPVFEVNPYFSPGAGFTLLSGTYIGTSTEYDVLGRVIGVSPADQATFTPGQPTPEPTPTNGDSGSPVGPSVTYFTEGTNPWATISIDSEGKTTKSYRDAFGRVSQVVKVANGSSIVTSYQYDLVGNLTNTTDNSGNVIRVTYDSLGRKKSTTDPDMGTWTYFYDRAGRLTNQVDAKSQSIRFLFNDAVGRLTKKEVYHTAGTLAYSIAYAYDTNIAGYSGWKGAMTGMIDKEGWTRTGFDERGRPTNSTRYVSNGNTSYTTSTRYNDADQPVEIRYPSTTTVRIGYSYTNGILYRVRSLAGTGSSAETFYQLHAVNELGQPVRYATHNGSVTNNFAFYGNSKRLKQIKVAKAGSTVQDISYTFDKVSNLKSISDGLYSGSCSANISNIQYDDLHRLTSLTHAGGARAYAYNALGNIITNGDAGSGLYQYTSSKPHAVTIANGKSYAYDLNGNMIVRGADTLEYDPENHLVVYNDNAQGYVTTYGYAGDGSRLWKDSDGSLFHTWIGDIYEDRGGPGGMQICHVFAGGKRVASFQPAIGGPYASVYAPNTWWAKSTDFLTAATAWPFMEGRTPQTVLLATLLLVLACLVLARRGFTPLFSLHNLLLHKGWSVVPALIDESPLRETLDQSLGTLTYREKRWYRRPVWSQAVSVLMAVVLIFVTSPTEVHAQQYTPVFYYYHGDHLGSSNIMTDRAGVLVEHYEYTAFGDVRGCSANPSAFQVSNRYTGQVLDSETGLYYYNARYYDPGLGRFIQPDTLVPDPGDSQQFNRYTYTGNNPLKYTDPSGHDFGIGALIAGVVIGASIGAATSAATGGDIGMGALTGALGGVFGFAGAWAGGAIGGAGGAFAGAVAGGAVGGAVNAAITGGNIGIGALSGAIAGVIGFGVGQMQMEFWGGDGPSHWIHDLFGFASSAAGGALGGGIGSVLQGGSFGDGALAGAIGGAIGYAIAVDLPDAIANRMSGNPRFHLFVDAGIEALAQVTPDWLLGTSDFWAGMSDTITWNVSKRVRENWGRTSGVVDYNSTKYVGGEIAGAAWATAAGGAATLRPFTSATQQITRWGGPIESGKFVMTGGKTLRNYIFAGVPRGIRGYSGPVSQLTVPRSALRYPSGWEFPKGLLGQRVYRP